MGSTFRAQQGAYCLHGAFSSLICSPILCWEDVGGRKTVITPSLPACLTGAGGQASAEEWPGYCVSFCGD